MHMIRKALHRLFVRDEFRRLFVLPRDVLDMGDLAFLYERGVVVFGAKRLLGDFKFGNDDSIIELFLLR